MKIIIIGAAKKNNIIIEKPINAGINELNPIIEPKTNAKIEAFLTTS